MKTAKLRINYGRTVNTGNYNSVRLDISMEIEIDEQDFKKESSILFDKLSKRFDVMLGKLL